MIDMDKNELITQILELKKQRNAVIVAHNYQIDDVQEIADMVGDSFALAKYCAASPQDVIVFCGVRFMAESAKILSPQKTVLLPEINAGMPHGRYDYSGGREEDESKIPRCRRCLLYQHLR